MEKVSEAEADDTTLEASDVDEEVPVEEEPVAASAPEEEHVEETTAVTTSPMGCCEGGEFMNNIKAGFGISTAA